MRATGREYNALLESPCFKNAKDDRHPLTCASCHTMHQTADDGGGVTEWADDQLAQSARDGVKAACLLGPASGRDPERVAQVLRILLDNALVHTPEGTGVRVSAARVNGHVRLEVSDRGLGIKRQNMPHIFEPFFTSNDEAQGAGLGLAIARELAERMHGELSVRSVPGRTTFSLELPS